MRRRLLTEKERQEVINILMATYPDARCELNYSSPFELLIATMLSAQCTDIRVNMVTKKLFEVLTRPSDIDKVAHKTLENIIKPCGLFKTKAKNVRLTCERLASEFDETVPKDKKVLVTLPGVGIKTANVVVSNAYGVPAIAVDTHVQRVSNRLGLVSREDVIKTEKDLQKRIPKNLWTQMHHTLIFHGRYHCKARSPMCEDCSVNHLCMQYRKQKLE